MARALSSFLVLSSMSAWLPLCTQAHMQMDWPFALRSPLDPTVPESLKDYDLTFPLAADGSNFPCKHYQYNDTNPQAYNIKAQYQAGSTYNISLVGTATHMGGSCQISLSYDNGATFKVIQSIIGGCPLTPNYNFTIPSFAPSSDTALLSWSWFNLVGNREMYQNCARVSIQNQNQPIQRYRRAAYKRQASLNDLPDMFACNIGNGCKTIEHREVVFPNPGPSVAYGQDATVPDPGPGFTLTATPSGNAFSTVSGGSPSTILGTGATSLPPQITSVPYPVGNGSYTPGPTGTGYTNYTTSTLTLTNSSSISTSMMSSSFTTDMFTSSSFSTSSPSLTSTSSTTASMSSSSTSSSSVSTSSTIDSPTVITITVTVTVPPTVPTTTVSPSTPSTSTTPLSIPVTTTIQPIRNLATSSSSTTSTSENSSTAKPKTLLTSTTTTTLLPSSSSLSSPSKPILLPCTSGTFTCNSSTTFSQCVTSDSKGSTSYTYMGSVAAGMQCVAGQIIRQNDGPCTPNGQIFCDGETAFYMCDQGGSIEMGPVAAGTRCVGGSIVAA